MITSANSITVDLMRHGELVSHQKAYIGQTDIALSEAGYQAMQALVQDNQYEAIISSPLSRCAVFAKDFAADNRLPLQINENLSEIDFGEFEGKSAPELLKSEQKNALTNWWSDMQNHAPPNGESLTVFNRRVIKAFTQLIEAPINNQDKWLFVTHGGVIRCLLCYLMEIPLTRFFDFEVSRASLTRLTIYPHNIAQSRLIFLNKINEQN